MNPIVAILAGGLSSRMGMPKAGLPLADRPLLSYPVTAAYAAGLKPLIVAKRGTELPQLDCQLLYETATPHHPLCGIVTALRAVRPAAIIAVAADMPFVTAELLGWLATQQSTAAVEAEGRLQPLLARYSPEALATLETALAAGKSATAALRGLDPLLLSGRELLRFGRPELLCFNVNTQHQLARAEALLAARQISEDRPV